MIPDGLPDQFINWKPFTKGDGGVTKIPCDHLGWKINAHDKSKWLTYEQALQNQLGVAFVLDKNDPWFFLDLDKCYNVTTQQWSAQANAIIASFSGAWAEVSQSGKGLHVMGKCDASKLTDRRNKWAGWLEFYTKERFIAFSPHGWSAIGGAARDVDWTNQLLTLVPEREYLGELPDGIDPTYTGPKDDEELLNIMLRSRNASATFGSEGAVTFTDLWEKNVPVLAQKWPSYDGKGPFDHSSADMALMSHLAFWTGKDMPRMDRLFKRSGLMRDKYDKREDYRKDTVQKAARLCSRVYDRPQSVVANIDKPSEQIEAFLSVPEMQKHFEGCVYIRDMHRVFVPDGALLKPEQFNATYGGHLFTMFADGTKPSRKAFEALTQNTVHRFPQVYSTCFKPDYQSGHIFEKDNSVNIYVKPEVQSIQGDVSRAWDLMTKQLPDERDRMVLINYLAAIVQYPGVKFQWCPVLQGCEGNGKSFWARCIIEAVGRGYSHTPRASQLEEKYNDYVEGKIFINIEEIWMNNRMNLLNELKEVITNDRIEVRSMGIDKRMIDNVSNWLMCTNYHDGVIKKKGDRRYAIFYTAQQDVDDLEKHGMSGDYFPSLYNWVRNEGGYANITHWLQNFDIDPELNPATNCHRAPVTSSTEKAIGYSMGPIEQEITEAVESSRAGFHGGWINSYHLRELLKERGMRVSNHRLNSIVEDLGYSKFGRAPAPLVSCLGQRPTLWFKGDTSTVNFDDCRNAQGWG